MSIGSESDPSALENLSALSDGELDSNAVSRACAAWRDDAAVRSRWHVYQLIGDVLRSDDLASPAPRDAAFLAALRVRLMAEPTVLAPLSVIDAGEPVAQPAARVANAGRGRRRSWMAPSAVAAGFVLVAGAVMVTRSPSPGTLRPDGAVVATGNVPQPAVAGAGAGLTEAIVVSREPGLRGPVIRDARLERYLAAHQQFAGTSVLGVPSGFLRNAAAEAPNR